MLTTSPSTASINSYLSSHIQSQVILWRQVNRYNSFVNNRDVNDNETRESWFFLSIPGKEFSDFRESRLATARQQAYCERDNCYLSLHACYQSIACLLHRGRGPHSRCTDAAKQRTLAYLSGMGQQMFLPPGTTSTRQCKCGRFKKDHWDVGQSGHVWRRAWGLRYPASRFGWRSLSPISLHVCVLTGAPRCRRPSHCPLLGVPILPRRRPIVQRRQTGGPRFPGPPSEGQSAIVLPRSRSPCSPSPSRFVTFRARHCLLCRSIDGVPSSAGNSTGVRPAIAPALRAPADNPTPITPVKGTGRNRESWSRPGNCDSRLGNAISWELTSLINNTL